MLSSLLTVEKNALSIHSEDIQWFVVCATTYPCEATIVTCGFQGTFDNDPHSTLKNRNRGIVSHNSLEKVILLLYLAISVHANSCN